VDGINGRGIEDVTATITVTRGQYVRNNSNENRNSNPGASAVLSDVQLADTGTSDQCPGNACDVGVADGFQADSGTNSRLERFLISGNLTGLYANAGAQLRLDDGTIANNMVGVSALGTDVDLTQLTERVLLQQNGSNVTINGH
jgi:hypothetical protein